MDEVGRAQAKQRYTEARRELEEHVKSCELCKFTWKNDRTVCDGCHRGEELASAMDHFALYWQDVPPPTSPEVYVYSFRPKGASKQRRWAVATGDGPNDVTSSHGTKEVAVRAGEKLAGKMKARLVVEL